jgi:vacuolar-type H+-ATPase subunit F/Vma7
LSDVLVIAGSELNLGFRLAGVDAVRVADAAEAADLVREEMRKKEHTVVIVDEGLFEKTPKYTRQAARQSVQPMVLAVPMDPSEEVEGAAGEYVQNLVREAVGFSVKI